MTILRNNRFQNGGIVGPSTPPVLIAETGMAHNNQLDRAEALVQQTKDGCFDIFKTQIYNHEGLYHSHSMESINAQKREPDTNIIRHMRRMCDDIGLPFCISAHDLDSLQYVLDYVKPDILKIGSGEWRNWHYIEKAMESGLPLIISTGMYDDRDLADLYKLTSGYLNLAILHCVTKYPHDLLDADIRRIDVLKSLFVDTVVGFSDHSEMQKYDAAFAAVARGASIIERHIDLRENSNPGRDRQVSVCSKESMQYMAGMVDTIWRTCYKGYEAVPQDEDNEWARRSPYATRDINSGELISPTDYVLLRPGGGLDPDALDTKRRAHLYIPEGTKITEDHLEPL